MSNCDDGGREAAGQYYTVKDVSQVLDGLDVKVGAGLEDVVEIVRIRNRGILIGDRPWSMPVSPGTLFVARKSLFPCEYPDEMEFAADNPYGEHLFDCQYVFDGGIVVARSEYDNAMTVTVFDMNVEPKKTLYSQSFFGEKMTDLVAVLLLDVSFKAVDSYELVFHLKEIHETGKYVSPAEEEYEKKED